MRRHARRRGLTVGSCHGDAAAALEDPGEGCGAWDNGDGSTPGLQKLRVRLGYGRGDHHPLSVPDLIRGVPDVDRDACLAQPAGVRRLLEIRARDAVASSGQDLGYAAHSCPADADHVYVHAPYSFSPAQSNRRATSPAAPGVASAPLRLASSFRRASSSNKSSTRSRSSRAPISESSINSAAPPSVKYLAFSS